MTFNQVRRAIIVKPDLLRTGIVGTVLFFMLMIPSYNESLKEYEETQGGSNIGYTIGYGLAGIGLFSGVTGILTGFAAKRTKQDN